MAGGTYSALSGLQTRLAQLDRIASDIANAGTAGYKTERVPTVEARRPDFDQVLQTAIDVAAAPGLIDFRDGSIQTTNRDLDVALDGRGFFEIETAQGPRYTRNGQFSRRPDGTLVTADGNVVRGDGGAPIVARAGRDRVRAGRHRSAPAASSPASSRSSTSATTSACAAKGGRFRAEAGVDAGRRAGDVARPRRRAGVVERAAARADGAADRSVARLRGAAARHHHADERRRRPRHLGAGPPLGGARSTSR